jgi:hypothetical protein
MECAIYIGMRGILTFDPELPGKGMDKYVIQKTLAGYGNVPCDPSKSVQVRRWVTGTNPNTPSQQAHRAIFADGVAAWHTLSEEDKKQWTATGSKQGLNGFQSFMSYYLKTHPL